MSSNDYVTSTRIVDKINQDRLNHISIYATASVPLSEVTQSLMVKGVNAEATKKKKPFYRNFAGRNKFWER